MTRKRKRLPYRIASRKGFYLNPIGQPQKLSVDLGSPPSTGAMVLQLLSALPVQRISVFGFDFFSSMSNSGSRTAAQVPHDFEAERKYAERIYMSDPKFTFF
ncbi:hypothetical protein [Thalassovita sp.]|uniref:hypothetical protein n=1 Tax=Thalassovita sp. TaxID=1979401 RepID=UPI0029DE6DED|nr:hypothetical protein [Thalassovita sp.]